MLEEKITKNLEEQDEQIELITPENLRNEFFLNSYAKKTIQESRETIKNILDGKDERLLLITGPCSIDNENAAMEYATKLKELKNEVQDKIYIVMRTYLEKPRTNGGWEGILADPQRDGSYKTNEGIKKSRKLLINILNEGIPTATELLDPLMTPYINDTISYASIGARTTESPIHRKLASDLNMPVGFKNTTDGNIETAINATLYASKPRHYTTTTENGRITRKESTGNKYAHIILRGGNKPNYDEESINKTANMLKERAQQNQQRIIIDCSHGNSQKDYTKQPGIALNVANQKNKNKNIAGIMLESYLEEGAGEKYGQSKTDSCINWDTTARLIKDIYKTLK